MSQLSPVLHTPVARFKAGILLAMLCLIGTIVGAQSLIYHYPIDSDGLQDAIGGWGLTPIGIATQVDDRFGSGIQALECQAGFSGGLESGTIGSPAVSSGFTIAAWINVASAIADQKIFGHFDPFGFSGPLIGVNGGALDAEIVGSSQTRLTVGTVPEGVWTHVAVTWEQGGMFRAFIDGSEVGSEVAMSNPVPSAFSTRNHVGSAPWNPSAFQFNGIMDDLRMYDYALTDLEVADLACPSALPAMVLVSSVSHDAAVISWTSAGGASEYWIDWALESSPSGPPAGSGTVEVTSTPALMMTGLMPGSDYRVFVAESCAGATTPWVGPISFSTAFAPCDSPSSFSTTFVTDSSATISWLNGANSTTTEIEWGEPGFPLGSGTLVTTSDSLLTIESLESATLYEYYARHQCTGNTSDWYGPFSFTTGENTSTNDPLPAWHSIAVDAGSRLVELGWDGPGNATFRIFDPIGRLITGGAFRGTTRVVLPSSGWYVVEIQGRNARAHRELVVL